MKIIDGIKYLSTTEVSAQTGLTPNTIQKYITSGRINGAIKPEGRWLVPEICMIAYMRYGYVRRPKHKKHQLVTSACPICGKDFVPVHGNQKYCSHDCHLGARRKAALERAILHSEKNASDDEAPFDVQDQDCKQITTVVPDPKPFEPAMPEMVNIQKVYKDLCASFADLFEALSRSADEVAKRLRA